MDALAAQEADPYLAALAKQKAQRKKGSGLEARGSGDEGFRQALADDYAQGRDPLYSRDRKTVQAAEKARSQLPIIDKSIVGDINETIDKVAGMGSQLGGMVGGGLVPGAAAFMGDMAGRVITSPLDLAGEALMLASEDATAKERVGAVAGGVAKTLPIQAGPIVRATVKGAKFLGRAAQGGVRAAQLGAAIDEAGKVAPKIRIRGARAVHKDVIPQKPVEPPPVIQPGPEIVEGTTIGYGSRRRPEPPTVLKPAPEGTPGTIVPAEQLSEEQFIAQHWRRQAEADLAEIEKAMYGNPKADSMTIKRLAPVRQGILKSLQDDVVPAELEAELRAKHQSIVTNRVGPKAELQTPAVEQPKKVRIRGAKRTAPLSEDVVPVAKDAPETVASRDAGETPALQERFDPASVAAAKEEFKPRAAKVEESKPKVDADIAHEQPAKADPSTPGVARDDNTIGLSNRAQAREINLEKIAPPEKGVTHDARQAHAAGRAEIEGSTDPIGKAEVLAKQIADEGRPFNWKEAGMLLEGDRRLSVEVNAARSALDDAIAKGADDVEGLQKAYEDAKGRRQAYVDNVQKGKTEWHNTGAALNAGTEANEGNFADVIAEVQRSKGKVVDSKRESMYQKLTDKVAKQDEELARLNRELDQAKAQKVFKRESTKGRTLSRQQVRADREKIFAEIDEILKGAAKVHDVGSVVYETARFGNALGKLAINYMKEGVATLEEVIVKTLADFRARGIEATREDVLADINTLTTRPSKRSDLEKQIAKLKAEAKRFAQQIDQGASRPTKEATRLDELNAQIAELEGELASTTPKVKMPDTHVKKLSDEVKNAQARRDLYAAEVRARMAEEKPKDLKETARQLLNKPTSIRASIDISAPGRQGWLLGVSNPDRVPVAFWEQLRAMANPVTAVKLQNEILSRANAPLYKRGGLELTHGAGVTPGEELFMGRLFPHWTKFNPFRASDRAYSAYLNRIRADVFDRMVKSLGGNATDEELKLIGNYINVATGRGGSSVGVDKIASGLSNVLFAPRFVASRFEYAMGQPLLTSKGGFRGTGRARRLIAKQYAQGVATLGTIFLLAKGTGADVSFDQSSSDFLKLRFGDRRIDPLAGLQQGLVLGYRLWTGKYKTSGGREIDLTEDKFGQMKRSDVFWRFVRSKLNPAASAAWSLADKKDYLGNEFGVEDLPKELLTPMTGEEIVDELVKDGMAPEDAWSLLNIVGISTSNQSGGGRPEARN